MGRLILISLSLLLSVACSTTLPSEHAPNQPADMVLLGGKVLTVDAQNRVQQALAIRGNRIVAVGRNADVKRLITDKTQVIHLDGQTVVPGFIETHCHSIGVARSSLVQEYAELSSIAEVQEWIRQAAKQATPGQWISVPRNPITRLQERRHPTPAELDAACTTHPVVFVAARKHALNTLGFKLAGITKDSQPLPNTEIIRDTAGNPVLLAGGQAYLNKVMPPRRQVSDEETVAALRRVHRRYNKVGITSIFERAAGDDRGYRLYEKMRDAGWLTVRSTHTFRRQFRAASEVGRFVEQLGLKPTDGDDWVKPGPLKITVDGGIHWGTTRLREPYGARRISFYRLSDPLYQGDLRHPVDRMTAVFAEAHRLGWQMSCHVTGDAGVDRVLDALEAVHQRSPVDQRRFTLIHAYFPTPVAIERGRRLGVCVDTQSYLYYKDAAAMAEVYGPEWAARLIGIGDWTRGGIPTAINSDHMVGLNPDSAMNAFNPLLMLYIAVTRKDEHGNVYGPHQKLSRLAALRTVTATAAYLSFDEDKLGSLEPGKYADLAILDRDYLTCPEDEIRHLKVLNTMVGGRIVYP